MQRRRLWVLASLVALAILVQFRAPLLGRVYWFEDVAAYFHPLWTAAARLMRWGALPSWDQNAWCGIPLLGDPQVGALYPLNWLWLIVPPLRLYAWLQLTHAGLGAAGMWALARTRGRSHEASAVAALALGLGAFVVLQTRHGMFVATTAWVPWILWGIERYAGTRRLDHLAALAGAVGLALLAGGWSMLYFAAAVIAIYAIARLHAAKEKRVQLGAALAAAAIVGVLLSAAQLLPALAHARISPRALGVDYSFASSYAWPSWRYLLTLLVPTLYGDDARGTYHGASDQWELCGYAIGITATLLVPLALIGRERRGERIALLALCLVACDLARGDGGLLHPLFFRFLPFYGSLRCPARALYVWTLAAPILAADGLDAISTRLPEAKRGWLALVPLVLALELLITWRSENPSVKLADTRARPAVADSLFSRAGRYTTDVHLGQRFHNSGLLWGYESAGGYTSLPIWRVLHLYWIANHGKPYPHARLADDLTAQGLWTFSSPIVDLLGVRWVLAPSDRPIAAPGFSRVVAGSDGVDLWHNREAYPRAFMVYRARVAASDDEAARAVADPSWDPSRVAIVEHALDGVPAPAPGETAPGPTPYRELFREGPFDLMLDVETKAAGVLVVSEPWHPGWRAFVDGKPVELLRVDYGLRGVRLPAGHHAVTFELTDRPLAFGSLVSVLALVALLLWTIVHRRRMGRIPPPTSS